MKKEIAFYVLGLITVSLFSFSAGETYQTMKPKLPKSTVVTTGHGSWKSWVQKGYQIKQMEITGDEHWQEHHYLLVKY